MIKLKKITAIILTAATSLSLASCLRDASGPPNVRHEGEYTDEQTHIMWQTAETETAETEIIFSEPEISEAAQMWIDKHSDSDSVIMTPDEIKAENRRILNGCAAVVDILDFKELYTEDELKGEIDRYGRPNMPSYDSDGSEISEEYLELVLQSRAIDGIKSENATRRGIVTSRANLRAIPDAKPYRKAPDDLYDTIQQTELHVGTPVWVLHESADKKYLFVRSYNYSGWVDTRDVATTADDALWRRYASCEEYVRITEPRVYLCGEEIDMGVALPLVEAKRGKYTVSVPRRDNSGALVSQDVILRSEYGVIGDLPYTYANFLSQAFKYEGTMYSWGGLDTGVDCSGFVANVMRTFGFMLPRDTKDQQSVVGGAVDVRGKSHAELSALLSATSFPTAVYYPGHVLFYLDYVADEGKYYFIHAPQIGEAVSVTTKTDLAGMTYIGEVGRK